MLTVDGTVACARKQVLREARNRPPPGPADPSPTGRCAQPILPPRPSIWEPDAARERGATVLDCTAIHRLLYALPIWPYLSTLVVAKRVSLCFV
jgi:hypothetical protein